MQYAKDNQTIIIDGRIFVPSYENAPSEIRTKIDALGGLAAVQPYTPPAIVIDDLGDLNAALTQEGSVVRALTLVMFEEINKLRKLSGQLEYNLTQFKTALKNKMR